jgi:hypothetical protein
VTPRLSVFFRKAAGVGSLQGAAPFIAIVAGSVVRALRTQRNPKQMEHTMPIHSTLLSWLFGHPQVADHDIRLTTADRQFGRDPDYKSLRWLNGQSPPDLPDGVSRQLLQDIGLDRSRT